MQVWSLHRIPQLHSITFVAKGLPALQVIIPCPSSGGATATAFTTSQCQRLGGLVSSCSYNGSAIKSGTGCSIAPETGICSCSAPPPMPGLSPPPPPPPANPPPPPPPPITQECNHPKEIGGSVIVGVGAVLSILAALSWRCIAACFSPNWLNRIRRPRANNQVNQANQNAAAIALAIPPELAANPLAIPPRQAADPLGVPPRLAHRAALAAQRVRVLGVPINQVNEGHMHDIISGLASAIGISLIAVGSIVIQLSHC